MGGRPNCWQSKFGFDSKLRADVNEKATPRRVQFSRMTEINAVFLTLQATMKPPGEADGSVWHIHPY